MNLLSKETVKKIYMLEMAENMLAKAQQPECNEIELEKMVFDEEDDLPFEDNSIDMMVSSLK